jgi:hypothetical protein
MSHSGYWIELKKTGTNSENAATGTLTLFEDDKTILSSPVFSGGFPGTGLVPIPNGTYTIRLDIRGVAATKDLQIDGPNQATLKPFYGIQDIPETIRGTDGIDYKPRTEWGSIRACLNEPQGEMRQAYRGNYLHGKERPRDYTHGCICERAEQILLKLRHLDWMKQSHVKVYVG